MPLRLVLRRLVPLLAAGAALTCAALPASAHDGQDERPGAVQLDLEVLLTPPLLTGETSTGGQQPALAVDSHDNLVATALKDDPQPVTIDQRAPAKVRAGSWRWQSGDDGGSFANVSGRPAQADTLVPGGASVAATTDDRGRGYLLESYAGAGYLTVTRSTEKDDIATEAVHPVGDAGIGGDARLAAHGDGTLFLLAADPLGFHVHRSNDAGASFDHAFGVAFDAARSCDIAVGHARGSRQVAIACVKTDGTVLAWTSHDDLGTLRRDVLAGPSTLERRRPAVAVASDGAMSVLVTTSGAERSSMLLRRTTDRGRTWSRQEIGVEPGLWAGASLAVNRRGRLAVAAYHRASGGGAWHVRLAVFDAGRRPVFVDFASHDPVTPKAWTRPPDVATALATGPDGRFHLLWTSVKVTPPAGGRELSLLRNVWSVRTLST